VKRRTAGTRGARRAPAPPMKGRKSANHKARQPDRSLLEWLEFEVIAPLEQLWARDQQTAAKDGAMLLRILLRGGDLLDFFWPVLANRPKAHIDDKYKMALAVAVLTDVHGWKQYAARQSIAATLNVTDTRIKHAIRERGELARNCVQELKAIASTSTVTTLEQLLARHGHAGVQLATAIVNSHARREVGGYFSPLNLLDGRRRVYMIASNLKHRGWIWPSPVTYPCRLSMSVSAIPSTTPRLT
jgi:hypothetical protein